MPKKLKFQYPQYAEARCYPKKRWLAFDFKFKKNSIKQAILFIDIFSSRVKVHTQKKKVFIAVFLRFFKVFARFSAFSKFEIFKTF